MHSEGRWGLPGTREKVTGDVEISSNYLLTVTFSVVVATVGLVRNNVAVIIGAMVIAPLLAPNMALSLATTLGDVKPAHVRVKVDVLIPDDEPADGIIVRHNRIGQAGTARGMCEPSRGEPEIAR